MVIFAIIDNAVYKDRLLGYLFYFERSQRFFTELLEEYDEWELPFIFSGFVAKGQYSIGSLWSRKFVAQRIIPTDRQNLGSILKENKLREYDEYKLLLLSGGRCAQDEICLEKTDEDSLFPAIKDRLVRKVRDCVPVSKRKIMIFFKDGKSVLFDLNKASVDKRLFANVLGNDAVFKNVRVAPGGNGIEWGEERNISAELLYETGKKMDLEYEDVLSFMNERLVDTSGACSLLGCSRQYINQLVREGKLEPIRAGLNNNLFSKADIEREI
ncbi:MAG: DUF2442 domain-containing protein [Lachnospiraceae bacterium]|nr:DUF2442 domain-containing protein [Lachnospiraceae bacterium]